MSMWINLARVSPEAFGQLQADPALVGALVVEQNADVLGKLGVDEADIAGLDYESAEQVIQAMSEVDADAIEIDDATDENDADAADDDDPDGSTEEDSADPVLTDLHVAGTLRYDAGFGLAFFLTPAAAKQAASYSAALGLDEAAKAIVEAAAQRGHYVVGVIS